MGIETGSHSKKDWLKWGSVFFKSVILEVVAVNDIIRGEGAIDFLDESEDEGFPPANFFFLLGFQINF